MPNITFYLSDEKFSGKNDFSTLTQRCVELCLNILHAKSEKIHIIYLSVQSGCGHPIYVEVRYRLESHRTPEVMSSFMSSLDFLIQQELNTTARIRCFGTPEFHLYAMN